MYISFEPVKISSWTIESIAIECDPANVFNPSPFPKGFVRKGLSLDSTFSIISWTIDANIIEQKVDWGKVDQIEVYQIICHHKYVTLNKTNHMTLYLHSHLSNHMTPNSTRLSPSQSYSLALSAREPFSVGT